MLVQYFPFIVIPSNANLRNFDLQIHQILLNYHIKTTTYLLFIQKLKQIQKIYKKTKIT